MRNRAVVVAFAVTVCSGVPAFADSLSVFYASDSDPRPAAETHAIEETAVVLVAVAAGADLRGECPDLCVWFASGEEGARMVLFRKDDGLSRERTVTFVRGGDDSRAIRANLRKVVIIARSLMAETQFEAQPEGAPPPVGIAAQPATPAIAPAPRDWLVGAAGGTAFLGTALSVNNVTVETAYRAGGSWLVAVSLTYLVPSGFSLDGSPFRAGGLSVRAAGGNEVFEAGPVVLRVFVGPQLTWYEFYRGDEPGQWVTHVQLSAGAEAGVKVYGPVSIQLRSDAAVSPANVIVALENSDAQKKINNPVFDVLAGVTAEF